MLGGAETIIIIIIILFRTDIDCRFSTQRGYGVRPDNGYSFYSGLGAKAGTRNPSNTCSIRLNPDRLVNSKFKLDTGPDPFISLVWDVNHHPF